RDLCAQAAIKGLLSCKCHHDIFCALLPLFWYPYSQHRLLCRQRQRTIHRSPKRFCGWTTLTIHMSTTLGTGDGRLIVLVSYSSGDSRGLPTTGVNSAFLRPVEFSQNNTKIGVG